MMKKFKTLVFVAASGMILTACGGANNLPFNADEALEEASNIDTPWQDYYAPATAITFAEGEEDLSLAKGETHTYAFQSEPHGLSANSFTWVSSDESVVTTTPGKVTAVGGGEATITVYSEEESLATLNVKVISKLVTIDVTPATLDLDFNEKVDLEVTYDPVDTTEQGVSFTVEGTGVTVSESGRVSAGNAAATGEIVVTSKVNQNISKRIPYKVSDKYIHVTGVNIVNPDTKLEINKSLQLNVTVTPDNAQNPEVVYSTDVEGIVSIDENGLVTPLAIGNVSITATSAEQPQIKDTLAIEVYKNVATDIDVGDTTVNLSNTGDKTHQITISYLKGTEPIVPTYTNVSYETSDASVATVNKDGLITMVAKGSAVISVKDKEISSDYVKEITVNCVVNATSVSLSGDSRIQEGGMANLTATISPNASTLSNVPVVTFEVVAGIDNVDLHDNGNGTATVTGLVAGTARIVAKAGTLVSNEFTITIVAPSFEDGGLYLVGSRAFNTGASVEFEGGSWNHPEKAFRFTERTGNANAKFEYKATITFEAGDEWKVRYGANEKPIDGGATGRYKIDEGAFLKGEMGVTTYDNPSVVVVVAGVYEIYYAFYENENPEGWYEVFVRAKPTLSLDKNELSIGIGADKVGYIKASDFEGTLQVTSADEETVVVKGYTTEGLITVQGLKEGSSLITVKDNKKTQTCMVTVDNSLVTYTVVGLPTWIGSDNCVVFAWVWSASDSGHWCPATINGTILTFAAPADITGFNLARCAAGTTEPDWKATGNVEGEVYNKTDDFTIVADKYSYQSLAWVEYEYEGGGDEPVAMTLSRTSVQLEQNGQAEVVVYNPQGEVIVSSDKASVANASYNSESHVITISNTHDATGSAVITVSDGTTTLYINVTMKAPQGDTFTVNIEADVSSPASWNPACNDYSLYVVLDDGTYPLGSFDECRGNMSGTGNLRNIAVDVPEGKKITLVIIYFYQSGVKKQSNDISCNIAAAGSFAISLGMTSWDGDTFNGATISAKQY